MKKIILLSACLILLGCDVGGQMASIYHDGQLVTDTPCNRHVVVLQNPDSLKVHVVGSNGVSYRAASYAYKNDDRYRVDVKSYRFKVNP